MKKLSFLAAAIFVVSTIQACGNAATKTNTTTATQEVEISSLKKLVQDGAIIVDVRTPEEFARGSVNNAINIPLDQLQSRKDELKDKKHIIVFCASGNRSGRAKSMLEQDNFNNVTNGGGWREVKSQVE